MDWNVIQWVCDGHQGETPKDMIDFLQNILFLFDAFQKLEMLRSLLSKVGIYKNAFTVKLLNENVTQNAHSV